MTTLIVCVVLAAISSLTYNGHKKGEKDERGRWQTETVERGYAEWVTASDGSTEWRWIEDTKETDDE